MSRSEQERAVAVAEATGFARGELDELTPHEIVRALDEYIIGQEEAKKAVAIALRNRWRRRHVDSDLRDEILPNNIIMIGPTGVGKTEIARRLARLAGAPFVKVEASKFTEVGYVGRDVESMVRDLVDIGVNLVREEREEAVRKQAEARVEERLLDLLLPPVSRERTGDGQRGPRGRSPDGEARGPGPGARRAGRGSGRDGDTDGEGDAPRTFVVGATGQTQEERDRPAGEPDGSGGPAEDREERRARTREKLRGLLRDGKLEDREVEVEVTESSAPALDFNAPGLEGLDWSVGEMLKQMMPKQTSRRTVTVSEARRVLLSEELETMIDQDEVVDEALHRVENMGIVFLDELDKVAGERGSGSADVSREGVQRDLLPIVEGSTVPTKYGMVETDHVLFIAAGAFHVSKPSDLIPELQGRFPIRVELHSLDEDDFVRILQEPRNALLTQYRALVRTEGAELEYTDEAIREMARIAAEVNAGTENIGARRLHTILTTLLEKLMFDLPDEGVGERLVVDGEYVRERLSEIASDEDLRRYIL